MNNETKQDLQRDDTGLRACRCHGCTAQSTNGKGLMWVVPTTNTWPEHNEVRPQGLPLRDLEVRA